MLVFGVFAYIISPAVYISRFGRRNLFVWSLIQPLMTLLAIFIVADLLVGGSFISDPHDAHDVAPITSIYE